MNLAPLRYRSVVASRGGPIRSLQCGTTTVMGRRVFQANAYLEDALRGQPRLNVVFGNPDGTGTARQPAVARHKAISEALERWAHATLAQTREGARYGFDVDRSSNGMAAFPGVFASQARAHALAEAAERFAVLSWWGGAIDAVRIADILPGVHTYCLENRITDHAVVLLHAQADHGVHAYAHGSGATLEKAGEAALVELARMQFVMRRFFQRGRFGATPVVRGLFERRSIFFATPEGYDCFQARLHRSASRHVVPQVVFDGEIPGPWSRYACVWRVALVPPAPDFLDDSDRIFFW